MFVLLNKTRRVKPQRRFHLWRLSFTGDVRNEIVDAVREVLVVALEGVWQMPALVALVTLRVLLDIALGGPEHVFLVLHHDVGLVAADGDVVGLDSAALHHHQKNVFSKTVGGVGEDSEIKKKGHSCL